MSAEMKTENNKTLPSKEGKKHRNLNNHPEIIDLRNRQAKELNDYLDKNRFYAYNDQEKFDAGMRMLGLDPGDLDKIVDVGGGAMRKDKVPELRKIIATQKNDLRDLKKRLMTETETTN